MDTENILRITGYAGGGYSGNMELRPDRAAGLPAQPAQTSGITGGPGAKPEGAGSADAVNKGITPEPAKICHTCANRRYQDVSGDPGVSFKAPTKLTPDMAAGAVMSHEREHYTREASKAEQEGREVLSNEIRLFTSICPECGKTYVSGGETRTVTRKRAESDVFLKDFFEQTVGRYLPKNIDARA